MGRPWKTKGMAEVLPSRAPYFGPFMPIFHDTGCWWGGDYGPFPIPGPHPGPKLTPGDQPIPQATPEDQPVPQVIPQDQPPVPVVPQDQPGPGVSVQPVPSGSTQPNPDTRFVRVVNPQESFWNLRDVDSPGYPWVKPSLHVQNYPTPGTFFDANNADGAFVLTDVADLVRSCLASALYMAGVDPKLATSMGATGRRLRRELLDGIQSSVFNDSMYGTSDGAKAGGEAYLGSHGRGVNLSWHHANNLDRLGRGLPTVRTTDVAGQRLNPHQGANSRPLIWLPAVNLDALRSPNPVVRMLQWEDDVSTSEPPPAVRQLGHVDSAVSLPGGAGYSGDRRTYDRVSQRGWSQRSPQQVWRRGDHVITVPTK